MSEPIKIGDEKAHRILAILNRWVNNEISTDQADRELEIAGVKLPGNGEENKHE